MSGRSGCIGTGWREPGESKLGARRHVGALLDLNPATLRNWVEDAGPGRRSGRSPASQVGGVGGGPGAEAAGRRAGAGERDPQDRAAFFAQAELDRRLK